MATSLRLAQACYDLGVCARGLPRLNAAVEQIRKASSARIHTASVDVGESAPVRQFVDACAAEFGRIDAVVNNAGYALMNALEQISDEQFDACYGTNIRGVFAMTRATWPYLKRQGGTVVNISSMAAIDPFPGLGIYGACKAWTELFTKAMASEGAEFGIRTFALRLGAVETPMLRGAFPDFPAEQALPASAVAERIQDLLDSQQPAESGSAIELAL